MATTFSKKEKQSNRLPNLKAKTAFDKVKKNFRPQKNNYATHQKCAISQQDYGSGDSDDEANNKCRWSRLDPCESCPPAEIRDVSPKARDLDDDFF